MTFRVTVGLLFSFHEENDEHPEHRKRNNFKNRATRVRRIGKGGELICAFRFANNVVSGGRYSFAESVFVTG